MICPNQPLHCDANSRLGSTGEPLTWYISQPAKCGPLTSQRSRLPSDVRMNAPFRVPTSTLTLLICLSRLASPNAGRRTLIAQKRHFPILVARSGIQTFLEEWSPTPRLSRTDKQLTAKCPTP